MIYVLCALWLPDDTTLVDRLRVLVVDDDAQVANTIARVLRPTYDVSVTESVSAAQRQLDERPFHIIVSDVCMPVHTGLDLYEWVRERSPELAECLVFVTGGTFDPRTAALLAALPNPRLGKPFGIEELRHAVDAVAARVKRALRGSPS